MVLLVKGWTGGCVLAGLDGRRATSSLCFALCVCVCVLYMNRGIVGELVDVCTHGSFALLVCVFAFALSLSWLIFLRRTYRVFLRCCRPGFCVYSTTARQIYEKLTVFLREG